MEKEVYVTSDVVEDGFIRKGYLCPVFGTSKIPRVIFSPNNYERTISVHPSDVFYKKEEAINDSVKKIQKRINELEKLKSEMPNIEIWETEHKRNPNVAGLMGD